jgi:serine/threonine protein kinase
VIGTATRDAGASLDATQLAHSDGDTPSTPPHAEDLEARSIGRFAVLRKVGEGGMGAVYAAFDERLARRVAIKLLHATDHGRLLREAQALARLSHPNVVQVYEIGEAHGHVFVAMEYVEGPTLAAWRAAAPRDAAAILSVFLQAGEGLHAAHLSGLVHRDFKPGNVIVGDDGRARVLDFGLARAGDSMTDGAVPSLADRVDSLGDPLTRTGAVLGTPAYMSPEQHAALPVDARSDQFGFCAALFEALYGERPFPGDTLPELTRHLFAGDLRVVRPRHDVPDAVHAAIVRGLAADPAARWPSMQELLQVLAQGQRNSVAVGDIRVWRWFGAGIVALWVIALGETLFGQDLADSPLAHSALFAVFASLTMLTTTPWLLRRFPHRRARLMIEFSLIYALTSMATRSILWWLGTSLLDAMVAESMILSGMHATLAACQRVPAMRFSTGLLLLTVIATLGLGLSPYVLAISWVLVVGLDLLIWRWAWPDDP